MSDIPDNQNPEFVGDAKKFRYLAIHGYERRQVDRAGKTRGGLTSEWIKDYCRKDSDSDYAMLTVIQRYTLDGLRRLAGLHGKWPSNDPMWVVRALSVVPKERHCVSRAVRELVVRGLVSLSNEPLGSLEVREVREERDEMRGSAARAAKTEDENTGSKPKPERVYPAFGTKEMEEFLK